MLLQYFPIELSKIQNSDKNNYYCDELLLNDLENWIDNHPDNPGFHECLIEAREESRNPIIPPWSTKLESQQYAWEHCSNLESMLRYITELKIEIR